MGLQEILAQMQGYGFNVTGGQGLGGLESSDIMGVMGGNYPGVSQFLTPGMFSTLSPSLIEGASYKEYSPLFQSKQGSLLNELMAYIQGGDVRKSYGGFDASGASKLTQSKAKDVYGKGMQDVYSQATQAKAQSVSTLRDIMSQWQTVPQSFQNV